MRDLGAWYTFHMIDLEACARSLVARGKGLLAADESPHSVDERLLAAGITPNDRIRRAYREVFLLTSGIEEFLSGVSLTPETLSQKASDGTTFAMSLHDRNIVPGVKMHTGYEPLAESPKEEVTQGMIDLPERLAAYRTTHHTGFTKWRAPIHISGDHLPTSVCIVENAKRLALYARYVQETGMVPVVEMEVIRAGVHSRVRAKTVLKNALAALVHALTDQSIDFSGVILETSIVLSGTESGHTDAPSEVAKDTLEVLEEVIPRNMLGIVLFSKGLTLDQDTDMLRAVVKEGTLRKAPWPLSFSLAGTLEEEALAIWGGKEENVPAAREAFLARLKKVSMAVEGQ